jgi:hypothetical protein
VGMFRVPGTSSPNEELGRQGTSYPKQMEHVSDAAGTWRPFEEEPSQFLPQVNALSR